MKIDSDHLRILRKKKGFTRPQLAKLSGITVRTIQRLEREPHQSQKTPRVHAEPPGQSPRC